MLTNKEISKQGMNIDEKIKALSKQLIKTESRIDKLYNTIETSSFTFDDLAPRLRKYKSEADELRQGINELRFKQDRYSSQISIGKTQLISYVTDLKSLLLKGRFFERKNFLKSFINRIEYEYPQVVVHYTFPLDNKKRTSEEVLAIDKISGVDETRTRGLLEGIIEVIDEFYSANLAQDTKRGMRESASRGFYTGSIPPVGYKTKKIGAGRAQKKTLVIDLDFAPIIEKIFKMALSGLGAKEIAEKLNAKGIKTNRNKKWSKNIVLYILRNEVYIGTLVWGKSDPTMETLRVENNYPAIIENQVFKQIQDMIRDRSPKECKPRTLNSPYLLSGLIYCGECGYALQGGSAKSGQFHYYSCNNSIRKGKTACSAKMINKDRIEGIIIDNLKSKVLTDEMIFPR